MSDDHQKVRKLIIKRLALNARRVSSELNQEDVFAFVTFLLLSYGRYDDYYGGSRGKVNLGSGELKLTFYQIFWKDA